MSYNERKGRFIFADEGAIDTEGGRLLLRPLGHGGALVLRLAKIQHDDPDEPTDQFQLTFAQRVELAEAHIAEWRDWAAQ
jgi:hypothetical protein